MTGSRPRSSLGARFALALATTLFWLAATEVGLRVALRGTVREMLASREGVDLDAEHRMLCVGDSYTFGLYYRLEESFPARLESLLNHGADPDSRRPWAVINSGIPAQNTAQVVAALTEQLETFEPEVVVVLAGHNNRWNLADPEHESALTGWFRQLALVKLVRILSHPPVEPAGPDRITEWGEEKVGVRIAGEEQVIDVAKTDDRRSDEEVVRSCLRDWRVLVERCHAAGARVVFTCYPSPEPAYAAPQEAARQAAEESDSLFVDVRGAFAKQLETRPYHELLIPLDRHPTDRGHFRIAVELARAMAKRGLVEWSGGGADGDEALYPTRADWDGEGLVIDGLPNGEFQVVVASSAEPAYEYGAKVLPVAADARFSASWKEQKLHGWLDDHGRARVIVPSSLREGGAVAAVVVFYDHRLKKYPDLDVRDISAAVIIPD